MCMWHVHERAALTAPNALLNLHHRGMQTNYKTCSFRNVNERIYYNYNIHVTKTVMQEEDENADCKVYGEDRQFETLHDCYLQEQEEFFMRKLGCVPPQFATNVTLMCRGKLDPDLVDADVENYFSDVAIDSVPSNCSTPCTTLDISTTLIGQTPRVNGSMVKLIMDKETTVVIVDFSMDIFKLTAEVGGYLGLWLGFSMLDVYSSFEWIFVNFIKRRKIN